MQEEQDKKIEELQNTIAELQNKVAELDNSWKRALADYRNLQKRTEEEKESLVSFISGMLLKRVLPVLDNLEMLEKHVDDQGLKLITKDFRQVLTEEGVTEIEAAGKDYDAETMEAIEMVPGEKNKIVEVLNKGYMLKNKLLRPARVKVGSEERLNS
jgi:molecular chaperone GrpE